MINAARDWSLTHAGAVRPHNEDALVCRAEIGLWAVADGAGGHHGGEVASGMIQSALETIPAALGAEEAMQQVRIRLAAVHDALRAKAAGLETGNATMASTVVVLLARSGYFVCLWAGDSRAYLLREGAWSQITRDHSMVQDLVDAGAITAAEAETHPRANVITRAVGAGQQPLLLDKVTGKIAAGDRFLLCSDGLCKTLEDATLTRLAADPANPAASLVDAALAAQVRDNVTAVVVEFGPDEADATTNAHA